MTATVALGTFAAESHDFGGRLLELDREHGEVWRALETTLDDLRSEGGKLVTTNGCFDLLHPGHLQLLRGASRLGDLLIVGLNSDASVRALKGASRPFHSQNERAARLLAEPSVAYVVIFEDPTPIRLLRRLRPSVHCKGGDYDASMLPETTVLAELGGRIEIIPLLSGYSTTLLASKLGLDRSETLRGGSDVE